jgi:protein-tyrosine phosphatase
MRVVMHARPQLRRHSRNCAGEKTVVEHEEKVSVLFVCMGNICRSPTAEGVFRKVVIDANLESEILVDSAGTHAYHVGQPPDRRAWAAAERRGIPLDNIHARRVSDEDFECFDYILAMDEDNLLILREGAPKHYSGQLRLFLEFSNSAPVLEVPDPYYGGSSGFERVLDLVESASEGLLETLIREHRLG